MATTYTIDDIAAQLDRLCPSQVDDSVSGNGHQEAGHNGHDDGTIGWYCAGGNAGNAVCTIRDEDIQAIGEHLASLPDGSLDDGGLRKSLSKWRIEWHV